MLRAQGLVRSAGPHTLLRDVELRLCAGEILVLRGDTGSGKSVLLRALARLDPLDAGQITLHGRPARELTPADYRARVAYLAQRPQMLGGTVEDELRAPLTFAVHRDRPWSRPQLIERLSALGKPAEFLAQPSEHLSGGEQQIVSLLRALLLAPEILLLDEPTAATDTGVTGQIEQLITDWVGPERGVLWVTHDPAQATRVGSRTRIMSEGRLA